MSETELKLTPWVEELKNKILGLSPTLQARCIRALEFPDNRSDILPLIAFLREGAMGNYSHFENVRMAYLYRYNRFMDKASELFTEKELAPLKIPKPKGRKLRIVLGAILVIVAVTACICIVSSIIKSCSNKSGSSSETRNEQIEHSYNSIEERIKAEPEIIADKTPADAAIRKVNLTGTVDKYHIEMNLSLNEDETLTGQYRYTETGNGNWIDLRGSWGEIFSSEDSGKYLLYFDEIDDKGNTASSFECTLMILEDDQDLMGTFTTPKGKSLGVELNNKNK